MSRRASILAAAALLWIVLGPSPGAQPDGAFKLGTFRSGGETFAGLVVADRVVARLDQADATLPRDLMQVIVRYDKLRPRLRGL